MASKWQFQQKYSENSTNFKIRFYLTKHGKIFFYQMLTTCWSEFVNVDMWL